MLAQLAGKKKRERQFLQCIAMVVTTLSPWAILFSRAAWESNVATCFIVYGVVCFFWAIHNQKRSHLSSLCIELGLLNFALAMYTYHSARFIAPILALFLFLFTFTRELQLPKSIQKEKWLSFFLLNRSKIFKYFLLGCGFLLILSPLLLSLQDNTVQQRLAETSIFADGHVAKESNALREQAGYSLLSKIFFHTDVFYVSEFAQNYLKHFDFGFLFVHGDANLRHSVQYFGQLYLFEVVFILAGLAFVFRQKKTLFWFLIFWLIIGVVPAELT